MPKQAPKMPGAASDPKEAGTEGAIPPVPKGKPPKPKKPGSAFKRWAKK
jgi:hypothetical protein